MKRYEYSEDMFAETRMSFGEHLEELRKHLLRALYGFMAALFVGFFLGPYLVDVIKQPVQDALVDYHFQYYLKHKGQDNAILEKFHQWINDPDAPEEIRDLNRPKDLELILPAETVAAIRGGAAQAGGEKPIAVTVQLQPMNFLNAFQRPLALVTKRSVLTTLSPQEMFMVYFKVCILVGFVIGSPWIFYQIWAFVAAGLYPHERRYVYLSLGPCILLFLSGVLLCQFLIIPGALNALLGFNLWLNVEPDFRLNEWLSFAILLPVVTGICFQTPVVMYVLGKIGIFTAADFASKRKVAIFIMLIFAAMGPSVDAFSLMLVWLPMIGLYELGIFLVRHSERKAQREQDYEVPYDPAANGVQAAEGARGREDGSRE